MNKTRPHKLRVAFAGTPDFILPVLAAIQASRHELLACWTQPERPAGRGLKTRPSAVKKWAERNNITVHQAARWDEDQLHLLAGLQADVLLVMAYGLLLPAAALTQTRLGCFGLHPSLLPRWRGAAPVARAIEAGDEQTGVTLMQMTERVDAGAIIKQLSVTLTGTETTGSLNQQLAQLASLLCVDFLDCAEDWCQEAQQQAEDEVCYAPKMSTAESWLDWHESMYKIDAKIRAFNPWPVARTLFNQRDLLIWEAQPMLRADGQLEDCLVGQAVVTDDHQLAVACREGALLVSEVQEAGKKKLRSYDFINGLRGQTDLFFCRPRRSPQTA